MLATDRSRAVAMAVAAPDQALAELAAGRIAPAREAEARAVALLRSVFGPVAPEVANVLRGSSQIEQVAGNLAAARAFAAEAVTAARKWALDDPDLVRLRFDAEVASATLVVLANQAALEADAGDPARALELYRRALDLLTRTFGPDHAEVHFVQDNHHEPLAANDLNPREQR